MTQQTLSIIKPDATRRNLIGKILAQLEENGLTIKALKKYILPVSKRKDFMRNTKAKISLSR